VGAAAEASYLCLAMFVDWDANESPAPGQDLFQKVGQPLADLVMVFDDGAEHRHPIRRRFEVSSPSVQWGQHCFTAMPHRHDTPSKGTDALENGRQWGDLQPGVWDRSYTAPLLWLSAIAVPAKGRLKAVRLESKTGDALAVCGMSLFHGKQNPLRYDRLALYRITLPEADSTGLWETRVDLGLVARTYQLNEFDQKNWLDEKRFALGEREPLGDGARFLYVEVTASPEASLTLEDKKTGRTWGFPLRDAAAGGRVEFLEQHKTFVHARVIDSATGRPTPARITMRSRDGRYIPPYGHRAEINTGWFQDYGADLKLHDTSYAFVDGTFQAELPVGEVYIEVTKGFEYQPVRTKLEIHAGQKDIELRLSRFADFRSKGWINADSHVHFLSPPTALLEGQAEGLNLINLLAAQWGDLFTNVGDFSHGSMVSPDREMMVKMGTENRNHLLGHLGLLGANQPVFPMSVAGPSESYVGDPLWLSLADWADRCRERDGLVVAMHFPQPTAELAADIVLGKIDAVEIRPDAPTEHFNGQRFLEWYHYLNCGYRLPIFGGTDKMSAGMAAGSLRGYAHLGEQEFTFANWAKAVRSGNTFMTSGPLLLFQADGRPPGAELKLRAGGGSIEVQAAAQSTIPIHR
ncbi:MAG: CehA/McbA family metallohydrolase, partial [Acidobacteria bacterium]|nr:CehA/McbA family metallohydrolase [Acidobacteriota bacterium]